MVLGVASQEDRGECRILVCGLNMMGLGIVPAQKTLPVKSLFSIFFGGNSDFGCTRWKMVDQCSRQNSQAKQLKLNNTPFQQVKTGDLYMHAYVDSNYRDTSGT